MNILALDYGTKRIGLAWVDTALGVVLPFGCITTRDTRNATQDLVKMITRENIDKLIIGLPIGLDGAENENTKRVREFGEELKNEISTQGGPASGGKNTIEIDFVDERFTTAEAERAEGGVSKDERAAMIILQSYIER